MKPNELVQHQKNITEYLKGLLRQIFYGIDLTLLLLL